jgi:hypothetical protein
MSKQCTDVERLEYWLKVKRRRILEGIEAIHLDSEIKELKKKVGVYKKFNVTRTDGSSEPGGKHEGCQYFVIDVTHDPFAKAALVAYAEACQTENPTLSLDLLRLLGETE